MKSYVGIILIICMIPFRIIIVFQNLLASLLLIANIVYQKFFGCPVYNAFAFPFINGMIPIILIIHHISNPFTSSPCLDLIDFRQAIIIITLSKTS